MGAEKGVSVHPRWRWDVSEAEDGCGEVDEADGAVGGSAGGVVWRAEVFELVGDMDDEGDAEAGVAGPAFASGHAGAVVGELEDDGVFEEAGFAEFADAFTGIGVGGMDAVVVLCPVVTGFWGIGVVGGDANGVGISGEGVRAGADAALVTFFGVEDGKKGLSLFPMGPMGFLGGFVPRGGGGFEVVVFFCVICAKVTLFAEKCGEKVSFRAGGDEAAHVFGGLGWRVHAGDEGGSGGGADGGAGPGEAVTGSGGGESVGVGGAGDGVAVAAEVGSVVFA